MPLCPFLCRPVVVGDLDGHWSECVHLYEAECLGEDCAGWEPNTSGKGLIGAPEGGYCRLIWRQP